MAFKQLYECEFCGKTKYFFPEQAIGAKCECETSIDLNNTWCEANIENEKYLYENVSKNTHNVNKEKYFIIEQVNYKLDVRTINYIPNSKYKQINLVDGKFEFVNSELEIMKEKYASGDYICINKYINIDMDWEINDSPSWFGFNEKTLYKLIHTRHKNILDSYLKDNNVNIEYTNYLSKDSNIDTIWYEETNFIENYNEDLYYRITTIYWYELKYNFPCLVLYKDADIVNARIATKFEDGLLFFDTQYTQPEGWDKIEFKDLCLK